MINHNHIPNIALVGNAPKDSHEYLNDILADDVLSDICNISLYGEDGTAEADALANAITDYREGKIHGIVCLPMSSSTIKTIKHQLGEEEKNAVVIYSNGIMKMSVIKEKAYQETEDEVKTPSPMAQDFNLLQTSLKRDFSIQNPRIAVLSYNEETSTEETSNDAAITTPLVNELANGGVQVFGPCCRKTFFNNGNNTAYDMVVDTHEGLCLNDFRLSSNQETIAIITNIDIPIAAVETPEGVLSALYSVIDMVRNRREYDRPLRNPLQKLYHERKEDGDKARFAVKKKGFNPAEHRRENINFTTAKPSNNTSPKE